MSKEDDFSVSKSKCKREIVSKFHPQLLITTSSFYCLKQYYADVLYNALLKSEFSYRNGKRRRVEIVHMYLSETWKNPNGS